MHFNRILYIVILFHIIGSFSHQKIHSRIHLFYWYPSVLEYWNMEYHNNGINSITFCFAILYKLEV